MTDREELDSILRMLDHFCTNLISQTSILLVLNEEQEKEIELLRSLKDVVKNDSNSSSLNKN